MPMECDGGESGGICAACKQARDESLGLYEIIMNYYKTKGMSKFQVTQSIVIAALTAVEVIGGKDDILLSGNIVAEITADWLARIGKSQIVELKESSNVANIMRSNRTIN